MAILGNKDFVLLRKYRINHNYTLILLRVYDKITLVLWKSN